jgi:hypothetical protein
MSTNSPDIAQAFAGSSEREKVYLDALKVAAWAPGTVCVVQRHYEKGRHPVPYRTGYCHNYRQENEHYHSSPVEAKRCPDAQKGYA